MGAACAEGFELAFSKMNVEDAGNNEDTTSKNSQSQGKNAKNYKTWNQQLINIIVSEQASREEEDQRNSD